LRKRFYIFIQGRLRNSANAPFNHQSGSHPLYPMHPMASPFMVAPNPFILADPAAYSYPGLHCFFCDFNLIFDCASTNVRLNRLR